MLYNRKNTLEQLTDVIISDSLVDNQVIAYDAAAKCFTNRAIEINNTEDGTYLTLDQTTPQTILGELNVNLGSTGVFKVFPTTGGGNLLMGSSTNTIGVAANSIVLGGTTGLPNTIGNNSFLCTIGGGYDNHIGNDSEACEITSMHSIIADNTTHGAIFGGSTNTIALGGDYSFIGGGLNNNASGLYNFIGAGASNECSGFRGSVIGGASNHNHADYSSILGGNANAIAVSTLYSLVFGRRTNVTNSGITAFSDSTNAAFNCTVADTFYGRFAGGYRLTGGKVYFGNYTTNGLVTFKSGTGELGVDTNTYLTTAAATSTYVPYVANTISVDLSTTGRTENIINGGFETLGSGGTNVWDTWTEIAGGDIIANVTDFVYSGVNAAKLTRVTGTAASVLQIIAVQPSTKYVYRAYISSDGVVRGRIRIRDVTNAADIVTSKNVGNVASGYTLVTEAFTTPAGCVSIAVYCVSPATVGSAWFDDISVKLDTEAQLQVSPDAPHKNALNLIANSTQSSNILNIKDSNYVNKVFVDNAYNLTANSLIKTGGVATEFLKADGSVDSSTYLATTNGAVAIGVATPNANAILDVSSTTKAFMPPRATTAQIEAVASPTEGMVMFDLTLHKLAYYNGTTWVTI